MTRTSEKCRQSGIYVSSCRDRTQVALAKGDSFPECRNHGSADWELVRATQTRSAKAVRVAGPSGRS